MCLERLHLMYTGFIFVVYSTFVYILNIPAGGNAAELFDDVIVIV